MNSINIENKLTERASLIQNTLENYLKHDKTLEYTKIFEAMEYSVLNAGKRLRPVILLEFCTMCGGKIEQALPFAVALEMIHTYSLIHDDLPCMDDDDIRRGKPTSHKVYGEALAVLSGDALLTLAFEVASKYSIQNGLDAKIAINAINVLAKNAGVNGMIGGQVIDILSENKQISYDMLSKLQSLKTGALLCSAGIIGTMIAGADEKKITSAKIFCDKLGLAFQIRDDILDIIGNSEVFGKPVGSDEKAGKSTFPALLGVDKCNELVATLTKEAISELYTFENNEFLIELAKSLINREK